MGRAVKDAKLNTRSARLILKPRREPYYRLLDPGLHLGYRRPKSGPGAWLTRRWIAGRYHVENLRAHDDRTILADDYADADGVRVLDFKQAQVVARALGPPVAAGHKLQTVLEAVDSYRAEIADRIEQAERRAQKTGDDDQYGGDVGNADRVLQYLPETLAETIVAKLRVSDFQEWKGAFNELSEATRDRVNTCLRAALNLAAKNDPEHIRERPWRAAIGARSGEVAARNVVLSIEEIKGIVDAAWRIDPAFGLYLEVYAVTGARASQVARLKVRDLLFDAERSRLSLPGSRKGVRGKPKEPRILPIGKGLALRLREASNGRGPSELLLRRQDGKSWTTGGSAISERFKKALAAYDPELIERDGVKITAGALRHSSISNKLKENKLSPHVIAHLHDTSLEKIRKHYGRYIDRHVEEGARAAMLDFDVVESPAAGSVVPLRG
jgi:integrase